MTGSGKPDYEAVVKDQMTLKRVCGPYTLYIYVLYIVYIIYIIYDILYIIYHVLYIYIWEL